VHTYSGHEARVAETLRHLRSNWQSLRSPHPHSRQNSD
jgi:hypothetical protein